MQHLLKFVSVFQTLMPALALVLTVTFATTLKAADISGTILETMDAAGYTYMNLDTGTQKLWVAIPQSKVTVGEKVAVVEGMEMKNFHSNSFDRTFDSIIFSPGLVGSASMSPHTTSTTNTPKPQEGPTDDSFASAVAAERAATGGGAAPVQPTQGSTGSMGSEKG